MSGTYRMSDADEDPVELYQLECIVGHTSFSGSDLTATIPVDFSLVKNVVLTPEQGVEGEQLGCDRDVNSGVITIERPASITSNLGFSYKVYGTRWTAGPSNGGTLQNDLIHHWLADDESGVGDGNPIVDWSDKIASTDMVVDAGALNYKSNRLGVHGSIDTEFGDRATLSSTVTLTNFTIFALCEVDSGDFNATRNTLFIDPVGGDFISLGNSGAVGPEIFNGTERNRATTQMSTDAFQLICWTNNKTFINGVEVSYSIQDGLSGITFNQYSDPSGSGTRLECESIEIRVYDVIKSDADIQTITSMLQSTFGF